MESRVVLFLVLSLIIIFTYPFFLAKMGISTPDSQETSKPIDAPTSKRVPSTPLDPKTVQRPGSVLPLSPVQERGVLSAKESPERLKIIEGDLYRVVLSSHGGTIKEWTLKKYTQKDEKGVERPTSLIAPSGGTELPLSLTVQSDPSLKDKVYALDEAKLELNKNRPTGTVVMTATLPDGRSMTKEITFYNDQYQADIAITANGFLEYDLALGSNFGITSWEKTIGGSAGAISMIEGNLVSEHPKQNTVVHEAGVSWAGLNDTYFMSVLIPEISKRSASTNTPPASLARAVSVRGLSEQEIAVSMRIPVQNGRPDKFILYAGPKEYDRLVTYHNFLEEAIDFGWFIYGSWLPVRLVAKPLFYILRFIYGLTQNYGWAIILLTVLIKVVFYPITQKSLVSMKQMAALQPKVAAIREKWAGNKEKMNKELMSLYHEAGVNPLGGCLPMLLQMPVFIALFNILYMTIDLKNAPFMFWIADLSSKDPYYVLPIIMGATMILQQMTQPSTMDPTQAKIMMFMPVVYTFFFLSFPAGLVLYWLVNNILSIVQQCWINKQSVKP